MTPEQEQEFEDIAQEAIEKASAIDVSLADFAEGLRDIVITIRDRESQVQEEIG